MFFAKKNALKAYVDGSARRLAAGMRGRFREARERLAHLRTRLRHPARRVAEHRLRVDEMESRMVRAVRLSIHERRHTLIRNLAVLGSANPVRRLEEKTAQTGSFSRPASESRNIKDKMVSGQVASTGRPFGRHESVSGT